MRITKKKVVGVAAVASVAALGAGTAFAFWTTAGAGTGTASVGTDVGMTISGNIATALLLDQTQTFNITVTNNATFAQHLSTLTFDFTPSNSSCLKAWFTAVQPTIPAGGVEVAAGGGTQVFSASLRLNNFTTTNQDACKSNSLPLSYLSS